MDSHEGATAISEADVRTLALVAGLPLDDERAVALARALESDLRPIRNLRDVEVGEIFPAEMARPAREPAHGAG